MIISPVLTPIPISSGSNHRVRARDHFVPHDDLVLRGASDAPQGAFRQRDGRRRVIAQRLQLRILEDLSRHCCLFWGNRVGLAMIVTVTLATTLGAFLPILFKRLKLDPALMSGPFITSIVDIVSLLVYFRIATVIFN